MNQAQRAYLRTQLIVAAILNALLSALFVWLVFGGMERIELWGGTGLAADLVPTTFMITLMTTIGLTFATRATIRKGALEALPPVRWLPANVFLRALLLALGATLLLVPLSAGILAAIWTSDWSYEAVLWFKIAFGVALGFLVTPIVVRGALGDGSAGRIGV